MLQSTFHFAPKGEVIRTTGTRHFGKGFPRTDKRNTATAFINPTEVIYPESTIVLRIAAACPEAGLGAWDLALVDNSLQARNSSQGLKAVRYPGGEIALLRSEEVVEGTEVVGSLVKALPGAKGLRYIANLYPFGKAGIRRQSVA